MVTINRTPTGIGGLDALIEGGFIKGKVYQVAGETGTGRTTFGLQFIYHGISIGEPGVYVSGDDKPQDLVTVAACLGWDYGTCVTQKKVGLFDMSPYFAELSSEKGSVPDARVVITDLTRQVRKLGAKRLVIDPLAPLVFAPDRWPAMQKYIRDFIYGIEDNLGCTVLVTTRMIPGNPQYSRYGVAEFITDGLIVLGIASREGRCVRTLTVRKMRCTQSGLDVHVFDIIPGQGIVLRGILSQAY